MRDFRNETTANPSVNGIIDVRQPTHLDLFSGIGGFALAFQRAGFKTIGFSEIDPYASAVLKKHWPKIKNYGDIKNIKKVKADIVTGGFPCQPFSLAGKRKGSIDNRALWPQMFRVIKEAKPTWVIGENVYGFISMELDRCISDLEGIGYSVRAFVIPACAVDAKHRRDRVWIVANANGCERSRNVSSSGFKQRPLQPKQSKQPDQTKPSHDSQIQSLADADKSRPQGRNGEELRKRSGQWIARTSNPFTSDSEKLGRKQRNSDTRGSGERTGAAKERSGSADACRWLAEPAMGRVAHGIPNRSHRLKGLGNAIVPQVAQIFAEMIYQISYAK